MKLTGKCEQNFEKWFVDNKLKFFEGLEISKKEQVMSACGSLTQFIGFVASGNCFGHAMQYGVYVDFFDSVGVTIELNLHKRFEGMWCYFIDYVGSDFQENFKTRHEAREQAIIKANKIYNESNK